MNVDKSLLYIYRPAHTALSIYTHEIELLQYKGHFKNGESSVLFTCKLPNASYLSLYTDEGYFAIRDKEKPEKLYIFQLKKGSKNFVRVFLLSKSEFDIPDFFYEKVDIEEGVKDLIQQNGLFQLESPISVD